MIKIRKTDGGDVFDLPPDYVIEAEKNNPMFSNKGSQTVPVNFPTTDKNNRLLNFPFRIDRSERQDGTIGVIVETGSVQQKGLLSVNSASNKIISANIGYDESAMYATFQNLKLNELPKLPDVPFTISGNNIDQRIDSILAHLTAVMKEQIETEYCVFPVVINTYKDNDDLLFELLNGINENGLLALENRIIQRVDNNEPINISAPKGYGVCPFLRVWRVLELIFLNFGFTVDENPFKEHRQLKKLCVLNNTMDTILNGSLLYKDMLPDITINDFFDGLYAKFGMLYFIDSNSKKVTFKFLKDLVNPNSETIDLTKNKTEELSIAFSAPKQLRLKMNREQEGAKTLNDTFEGFLSQFAYQFGGNGATQIFQAEYSRYKITNVFMLFRENPYDAFMYSSDFFDLDKKTPDLAYEDIEMKDLCLPISDYDLFRVSEYIVGLKHVYSELVIGGTVQDENVNPAKLAFIFSWGLMQYGTPMNPEYYPLASQINRDHKGNFINDENGIKYDISLTCNREDGLYNRFWKEYDAFIRHSNQEVTGKLHLTDSELFNLKLYNDVFIDNQPCLINQIKYKWNVKDSISEFTLRTLRLFKPYNIDDLWKVSGYENQKYYWAFMQTETNPIPPYPDGYVSTRSIEYKYDRNFIIVNGVQIPITNVANLPPTIDQFTANEQRIYNYTKIYHIVIAVFDGIEKEYSITSDVTVTFYPALVT